MRSLRALSIAIVGFAAFLASTPTQAADPSALWKIVHERCVPNELAHGDPAPCAAVDLRGGVERGYVVLKDISGATQFLVMPTARVTGIESPILLEPGAPNYFADAWREIGRVSRAAGRDLPRDDLSLAVNSALGRSQNQLHIHLECLRADVRDAVKRRLPSIGKNFAPLGVTLADHAYLALEVPGAGLDGIDPFTLLAQKIPAAAAAMDQWTLVVAGVTLPGGTPGFVILAGHVDPALGNWASGEELQDHSCALARP